MKTAYVVICILLQNLWITKQHTYYKNRDWAVVVEYLNHKVCNLIYINHTQYMELTCRNHKFITKSLKILILKVQISKQLHRYATKFHGSQSICSLFCCYAQICSECLSYCFCCSFHVIWGTVIACKTVRVSFFLNWLALSDRRRKVEMLVQGAVSLCSIWTPVQCAAPLLIWKKETCVPWH